MAQNLKEVKKDKKKLKWVWEDMILENSINILVGQQSRGKSMLVLGLVKELLKSRGGQLYLNRGVRKQRILYISTEMDEKSIAKRLAEIGVDGRMRGVYNNFYVYYNSRPTFSDITREIEQCNPDFVIIDILGGLVIGEGYDMNDYQSFNDIVPKLREFNKTILLIHHMNKQNKAMGSTGVLSAMDTRFEMLETDRDEDENYNVIIYQSIHKYGKNVQDQYINVAFKFPYFEVAQEEEIEELDKPLSKLMQEVILAEEPIEGSFQQVAAKCKLLEKYQFNPKRLGALLRMNEDTLKSNGIYFETNRKTKGMHLKIWYEHNNDYEEDC